MGRILKPVWVLLNPFEDMNKIDLFIRPILLKIILGETCCKNNSNENALVNAG